MATINPFPCIRPEQVLAERVAALPYDVYSREEAKVVAAKDSLSFLNIDRAETQFTDDVEIDDPRVYKKAKELLEARIADGTFLTDNNECYYIYELIMNGRSQTGIVACASIDDYLNNIIKKHENTRADKEADRINHVDICSAQTGPIFLAYRSDTVLNLMITKTKMEDKLYAFTAEDGVTHNVWRVSDTMHTHAIMDAFSKIQNIYIADGHHRAASAVKVGLKRREENPDYTGKEDFNFFLSVLFPEDQLMILPYNRVVKDLNGLSKEEFLDAVKKSFRITAKGSVPFVPKSKYTFGMYLEDTWYELKADREFSKIKDPVAALDVSILQDHLLYPILGIEDPRTDKRIDFIGGIRGVSELEKRVHTDMKIAFSMFPTSISELFSVSDAGKLMPPKSTWFEPKLRSGLFIHKI